MNIESPQPTPQPAQATNGLAVPTAKSPAACSVSVSPPAVVTPSTTGTLQVDENDQAALVRARDTERVNALQRYSPEVRAEAAAMLADPALMDRISKDINACGVVGEDQNALMLYLIGTSRLLETPLSAIVQGSSSSGKSRVIEKVAQLFPKEDVLMATDISPQALYYGPPSMLVHRFVVAGERRRGDGQVRTEPTRPLREMLSSGKLEKLVTTPNTKGPMQSVHLTRYGPIAFVESTTDLQVFHEDSNRMLRLSSDETPEQTKRVLRFSAQRAAGVAVDVSHIRDVHHAAQLMLERVRVEIPFAIHLCESMPADRPESRRAFGQLIATISASVLLHQRQRNRSNSGAVVATLEDYRIAQDLLQAPLARALGHGLPAAAVRFGAALFEVKSNLEFTPTEVLGTGGVSSHSKVNEYLSALREAGFAEQVTPGIGNKPAKWKLLRAPSLEECRWLPTVEAITAAMGSQQETPGEIPVCATPTAPGQEGASPAAVEPPLLSQNAEGSTNPENSSTKPPLPQISPEVVALLKKMNHQ